MEKSRLSAMVSAKLATVDPTKQTKKLVKKNNVSLFNDASELSKYVKENKVTIVGLTVFNDRLLLVSEESVWE